MEDRIEAGTASAMAMEGKGESQWMLELCLRGLRSVVAMPPLMTPAPLPRCAGHAALVPARGEHSGAVYSVWMRGVMMVRDVTSGADSRVAACARRGHLTSLTGQPASPLRALPADD